MAYPTRLLQDDEDVALDLRPHWWFFGKQILTGIPLVIGFFLVIATFAGSTQTVFLWVWAALAVVWAGWLGIKYFDWTFTYFVVTSERVIFRTGVISKRGVEIPLSRINNINFSQRPFERIIGAGDLSIESAGKDGQSTFSDVRHPDGVQQEIYRVMEEHERRRASWSAPTVVHQAPAAAPAPAAGPSIPEQIDALAKLRDSGALSEAEFQAKKQQLLDRM
jgi:uncharacterized membrane protein YdbT with pleckstrin-like domain